MDYLFVYSLQLVSGLRLAIDSRYPKLQEHCISRIFTSTYRRLGRSVIYAFVICVSAMRMAHDNVLILFDLTGKQLLLLVLFASIGPEWTQAKYMRFLILSVPCISPNFNHHGYPIMSALLHGKSIVGYAGSQ